MVTEQGSASSCSNRIWDGGKVIKTFDKMGDMNG